jgi:hypothetical protein
MRFVLVHGSWHDGSLLAPVVDALRDLVPGSHEVLFTNPVGAAAKLVEAGRD